MTPSTRAVALAGAVLALAAVVLAALGSHALDMKGLDDTWRIGTILHLFNAVGLLALAGLLAGLESSSLRAGAWLVFLGTVLFSGSIYVHVVTGFKLPNVAPAGGMVMIAGWLLVVLAFLRRS